MAPRKKKKEMADKASESIKDKGFAISTSIDEQMKIRDRAIASSISGIAIGDLEGRVMYVNKAALEMWGGDDASEILGRHVIEFAESEEEARQALISLLKRGWWSGEIAGKRKDGSTIIVHLSANLVYDDKGAPICTMASYVDITERKRMEDELRLKEYAIQSSMNGIAIGDLDGNITYANDAFLSMLGVDDTSEILGKSAVIFAESVEKGLEVLNSVREEGHWKGEVVGKRKDGTPIVVELSANLVRDDEGRPVCLMASFVDITERKRMEDELRLREYAIQSSMNGIAMADLEGNVTYVNDAGLRMWGGVDRSEIIGKNAMMFAGSKEVAEEALRSVLEHGSWVGEGVGKRKDGTPVDILLSANLVRDDEGRPVCLMASFSDITDLKKAKENLEKLNQELESKVEERTRELVHANEKLRKEIEERKLAESELMLKEKELRLESLNLAEANTALKVLLKRREQDREELEEKVLTNVKELIFPYIEKLESSRLDGEQNTYVGIIKSNLENIISPFLSRVSSKYLNFTPMEIQVANLVKEGKSTKEMADILNVSDRAIEFHRNNIRKKLGLKNKKVNLRSYLMTLSRN